MPDADIEARALNQLTKVGLAVRYAEVPSGTVRANVRATCEEFRGQPICHVKFVTVEGAAKEPLTIGARGAS